MAFLGSLPYYLYVRDEQISSFTHFSNGWLTVCRYDIMSQCWYENPAHRPAFRIIRHQLDVLLGHQRNYLDLDNVDTSSSAAAGDCSSQPLRSTVQLVLEADDEERDDNDSYIIDSSPLVVDVASLSSPTSTPSSTNSLSPPNACRVWSAVMWTDQCRLLDFDWQQPYHELLCTVLRRVGCGSGPGSVKIRPSR